MKCVWRYEKLLIHVRVLSHGSTYKGFCRKGFCPGGYVVYTFSVITSFSLFSWWIKPHAVWSSHICPSINRPWILYLDRPPSISRSLIYCICLHLTVWERNEQVCS